MKTPYSKPLPVVGERDRAYWEGLREGEVRLLACDDCGHVRYESFSTCPGCGGERSSRFKASGRGTLWSWARFHKAYFPGFVAEMPYVVAVVELEEGPKVYSNLVDADEPPPIGAALEAVFEDVAPGTTLLKFRLAR